MLVTLVFFTVTLPRGGKEVASITPGHDQRQRHPGTASQLRSAGAFVSIAVPVLVFLLLQRYFVRALLAGSVKG